MDPRALIGMVPAELTGLLGTPVLLRRDAPAEIWQYGSADCVLDLTLYPNESQALSVRYMESRARDGERVAMRACLAHLLAAREKSGG